MVIYDDHGQARYDFAVAPGANPAQIEIAFDGAENLKISNVGDLVVSSPYGDLTHKAPFSHQDNQEIESYFEIRGERSTGFKLGACDDTRELTIDPALVYSSHLGGASLDNANGVAVDSTGAEYVTGQTSSGDFLVAGSPFQSTFAWSTDVYVTKFTASGSSLVFSSYLGGGADDDGRGIAVDSSGIAFVTGRTNSVDFPVAGSPFQSSIAGSYDCRFIRRICHQGQYLWFCLDLLDILGGCRRRIR